MRYNIISIDEFGITKVELSNMLKNPKIHIISVSNELEAEKVLDDGKYVINAVLITVNSVDFSSYEILRRLKSNEDYKHIPIIIISKFTDKKYIIKAVEMGAVDFIAKPYNEDTVVNKIYRVLGIPLEKSAFNLLDEDIVTYNFKEMLNKEVKAASRASYQLSIAMFTIVNENNVVIDGEDMEDILNLSNRVIKSCLRDTDISFHYSATNIIIILPFTNKSGLEVVQKKINRVFNSHSMIKKKNTGLKLVSAGVTYPDDGKIKENLMEKLESEFEEILKKRQY